MAKKLSSKKKEKTKVKNENLKSQVDQRYTLTPEPFPEIVFGIVGPLGIDLEPLISVIHRELNALDYTAKNIRLSTLIEKFFKSSSEGDLESDRINKLMNLGTKLRTKSEKGDAVALLAIAEINLIRKKEFNNRTEKNAYILRSLKHPDEVETLRRVYGKGFFLISVFSPREVRVTALAERLKRSEFAKGEILRAKAEELITRDEQEDNSLGQDVKDAFPLADLFVDGRNIFSLEKEVRRFLELLFGNVFHTPSRDEHGMHHARSAALRSADLNRQVGAAILRTEGDLLALGCNDAPKAGGDLYWPEDKGDARDFHRGIESMASERIQVIGELVQKLNSAGLLVTSQKNNKTNSQKELNQLVQDLISGSQKDVLKGSRVMGLLEFGRSVHAEMAALMSAARLGISVQGATLYCTTFPCHMCARHIVASGIKRVVYVEPYPKSKAKQLHQDSIRVDPIIESNEYVNFEPFQGVAPRQYQDIFDAKDLRKGNGGKAVDWRAEIGKKPRFLRIAKTYMHLETAIIGCEIPILFNKLNVKIT